MSRQNYENTLSNRNFDYLIYFENITAKGEIARISPLATIHNYFQKSSAAEA